MTLTRTIGLATVVLLGATALAIALRTTDRISLTVASMLLPATSIAIALRPNYPYTTFNAFYIPFICGAMALVVTISRSRHSAIASLTDGIGVFLMMAVVLRYAGIGVGSSQVASGNLFTGGDRVNFPFAGTGSMGPTMAAAYLVAIIPILRESRQYLLLRFVGITAAVYVLVQGDRRSALLSLVIILASFAVAPRRSRQVAPWLIGFAVALPVLWQLAGLPSRLTLNTNIQSPLLRGQGREVDKGFQRTEIWSLATRFYTDRVDWFHQTFGFGTFGHSESGASSSYRRLLTGSDRARNLTSPHNTVLQTLFDGGWIAAIVLVVVMVWLARVIARRDSAIDWAALAMLTSLSIVGSTEAVLAPGYSQPACWTLMALCMIGFARERPPTTAGRGLVAVDLRAKA